MEPASEHATDPASAAAQSERKPVILSGITPSGRLTIGHYSGALVNWVKMQDSHDCLFMIADLHAITVRQVPAEMRKRTFDLVAAYVACGIDPEKSVLFVQSHVSAHTELAWVLGCLTGMGECSRMTQFKDKSQQHADNVNVGLFNYPVLMAADILLYQANLVPVGADQKQHLELTRNLAERFNFHYSPTFAVPEPYIPPVGARIMSLQDPAKKMSKSDTNERATIFLSDSDEQIRSKIRRAVTDSGTEIRMGEERPGISNLITLHHIATGQPVEAIEASFAGRSYAEFKDAVADSVASFLAPIRERFEDLRGNDAALRAILATGAEKARARAGRTLRKVYKKTGFIEL